MGARGKISGRPRLLVTAVLGCAALLAGAMTIPGSPAIKARLSAATLPASTYCQGPQPDQPAAGPKKVILLDLENESASVVQGSKDAPFQNGVLSTQCGTFGAANMHSTTHYSESNYLAQVSGLNAAIGTGPDAAARFGLSDCPPDSTSSGCPYGGGHFASTVPSIFSQAEQAFGTSGWKVYADDMPTACDKADGNYYATDATGKRYPKYVTRHNPAVFFNGVACATQDVPSGDWRNGQGPLYQDLMSGNLPQFSFIEPNDLENGHDPVKVGNVTVAGGISQIANGDNYLSDLMTMLQASPDYQSGNLVVMITYDEGFKSGPVSGEGAVGENCANPAISPLATSCQVLTFIAGRYVPNFIYTSYMNQFGLLAAAQRITGLSPLLGHAGDSTTPDIVNGTADQPDPFNLAPPGTYTPPPPTAPSAPTGVTASAGDASATVRFTTPVTSGGSPITGYTVTSDPGGISATGTASPITVPGLTNGTSYTFTVSAANEVGHGPPSAPSNTVVPADPPDAPTALLATPQGGRVALSWAAPDSNGGSPITDYAVQYTTTGEDSWTSFPDGVSTKTSALVTGLTDGTSYDFHVAAVNAIGQGDYSVPATATPTPVVPGAPTIGPATGGNRSAIVKFTPPSYDGHSPITGYTVTSNPGNITATGTASPVTVTGLTNGTAYTFTVTATNGVGSGPGSAKSNSVTPATVPSAPTNIHATAGNASATVTFNAPASNGGAPITSYTVTSHPGNITATGANSPLAVKGLTVGTAYTFTVKATNRVGAGAASTNSPSATPYHELLPDPGFETGNDSWVAFAVGTLTRITSPVHSGTRALRVAATSSAVMTVGIAQKSVVPNSVAGRVYTVQCYVRPTGSSLNARVGFAEYTHDLSTSVQLQTVTVTHLALNAWTLMKETGTALKSGERMVPQIYATNETTGTGSLIYDDCSVH